MSDDPHPPDPSTARSGGWWSTLPGILTASAAVITAISGLVAILVQHGGKSSDPTRIEAPASPTSMPKTAVDDKPAESKVASRAAPGAATTASDGAATGIAASPLHSMAFTGAVITQTNGAVVKLRDDIREFCQGAPVFRTPDGQLIEMKRIARVDVLDWRERAGTVRITLNNGETMDTKIEACGMRGTNDLGEFNGDFANIRSIVFVR